MVSSTTTSWPTLKPAVLFTCTDVAPFGASAVRSTDPASWSHRSPIRMRGFAVVVVLVRRVWEAPAPRRTMPFLIRIGSVPLTANSPAESRTTSSGGHASMAAWMPAVASMTPFP